MASRKAKAVPKIKSPVILGEGGNRRTYYPGDEEELQAALDAQPESYETRRGTRTRQENHRHLAKSGALENFNLDVGDDFDEDADEPDPTIRAGNAFRNARSESTTKARGKARGRRPAEDDDEGEPGNRADQETGPDGGAPAGESDDERKAREARTKELERERAKSGATGTDADRPAHLRPTIDDTGAGTAGTPATTEGKPASATRGAAGARKSTS